MDKQIPTREMIENLSVTESSNHSFKPLLESDMMDSKPWHSSLNDPSKPSTSTYDWGNPPRRPYTEYDDGAPKYKSKGSRKPIEQAHEIGPLRIAQYDPQIWDGVLENWKSGVLNDYISKEFNHSAQDMYRYLETQLSETAKLTWDNYKHEFPIKLQALINLGDNPHNFVNTISNLMTGNDPNKGSRFIQSTSTRQLEQLALNDWYMSNTFY